MAHNLNKKDGEYSFFSLKEPAWHGLGKLVQEAPTSEEAIKLAQLDYEVGLAEVQANIKPNLPTLSDINYIEKIISNRRATYRKDNNTVFGIVSDRYFPIQNIEAFQFFDSIVGEKLAMYETAGCLNNGEVVFITAKLPDYIRVGKEDITNKYLLLTMAHDGTAGITIKFTPIRVVCNNTLSAALEGSGTSISIRHSKKSYENLRKAKEFLQLVNERSESLEDIYRKFSLRKVSDDQVDTILSKIYLSDDTYNKFKAANFDFNIVDDRGEKLISTQTQNTILNTRDYYFKGVGQDLDTCKGTVYGVYNAITGYMQNGKEYKTSESKFNYINDGQGKLLTQRAFDICKTIIKN